MKRALNLARARKGLTGDNPSVGCVIVKKGKIISIGQTSFDGRPHAEHNAISNCNQNLKGFSFTVLIFAAVSLSLYYPQTFVQWGDFQLKKLIVPLLQIIMFGLGTAMSFKDFYGVISRPFSLVNKKPIVPNNDEIKENPRARSAKLRIAKMN